MLGEVIDQGQRCKLKSVGALFYMVEVSENYN